MVSRTEPSMIVYDPWIVLDQEGGTSEEIPVLRMMSSESSPGASICGVETDEEGKPGERPIFVPDLRNVENDVKTIIRPRPRSPSRPSVLEMFLFREHLYDVESLGSRSEVISEIDASSGDMNFKSDDSLEAYLKQIHQARIESDLNEKINPYRVRSDETLKTCVAQLKAVNAHENLDGGGRSLKSLLGNTMINASVVLIFCWVAANKDLNDMWRLFRCIRPSFVNVSLANILDSCKHGTDYIDFVFESPDYLGYTPL